MIHILIKKSNAAWNSQIFIQYLLKKCHYQELFASLENMYKPGSDYSGNQPMVIIWKLTKFQSKVFCDLAVCVNINREVNSIRSIATYKHNVWSTN